MLTRVSSFDDIEQQWYALLEKGSLNAIFVTPQWQRIWWEEFGDGAEKLLLCLPGQNGLEGLAPLMRRDGRITLVGDEDLVDYNDLLVSQGREEEFHSALMDYLEGESWDSLEIFPLKEESPTFTHLPDMARSRGYKVEIDQQDVCPGVGLTSTWDQYLQERLSRKDRHELRRKLRRLDTTGNLQWYCCTQPDEVEAHLDDFLALLRESKEEKARFLTPQRERFFRRVALAGASMGRSRLFFMELEGQKVASALCFDQASSRMLYNSGFNPQYGYYSVGLLLKALCLKDAIEDGQEYFDFLRGDEPYKYDLGGTDKGVYRVAVKRS